MFQKNSLFKKAYSVHVAVGLFLSLNIALLSLTGLVLLFKDEAQNYFSDKKASNPVEHDVTSHDYNQALRRALEQNPNTKPLAMFPDEANPTIIKLRMGENGSTQLRGSKRVEINTDPTRGSTDKSLLFDSLLEFHRELFLGKFGKLYVGIIGIFYTLLLLTGFFIYGRFTRNRKFIATYKAGKANRTDYHKMAGLLSFAWSLLVAITGVLLAFNGYLIKYFQLQTIQKLSLKYGGHIGSVGVYDLGKVVDSALGARPQSAISYISFPDTEFGVPAHFLVLISDAAANTVNKTEIVLVSAASGVVTEIVNLPWYLKALLVSETLHFGDFGGLPLKFVWAAFTVCSLAVVFLGVSSYFKKRSQKRVTVPSRTVSAAPLKAEVSNV